MLEEGKINQIKTSFGRSSYCTVANAHESAMKMVKIDPFAMVRPNDKIKI